MKKPGIVVIGGGFAGIGFIERMGSARDDVSLTLVDPSEESVFRPLLPDVLAGRVELRHCRYSLPDYCRSRRIRFLNQAASGLPEDKSLVLDDGSNLDFDYLVVACGADPEYHGNQSARRHAYPLYGDRDTARLTAAVDAVIAAGEPTTFVVAGGGYTGLEAATAIRRRVRVRTGDRRTERFPVRIVEPAPRILAGMPDHIFRPAREEIVRLGIGITTEAQPGEIARGKVEVNGEEIAPAICVWSAGTGAVDFVKNLPFEKDRKGRVIVDDCLHPPGRDDIYVLGDCACFRREDKPLRMAIQFSLAQGACAAGNFRRRLAGFSPRPYRPRDLGYLVPLASGKAWGFALGRPVGGRLGSFLHYLMSVYRSRGRENRWGLLKDLLLPEVREREKSQD